MSWKGLNKWIGHHAAELHEALVDPPVLEVVAIVEGTHLVQAVQLAGPVRDDGK